MIFFLISNFSSAYLYIFNYFLLQELLHLFLNLSNLTFSAFIPNKVSPFSKLDDPLRAFPSPFCSYQYSFFQCLHAFACQRVHMVPGMPCKPFSIVYSIRKHVRALRKQIFFTINFLTSTNNFRLVDDHTTIRGFFLLSPRKSATVFPFSEKGAFLVFLSPNNVSA